MSTFNTQLHLHHSSPLSGPTATRKRLVLLRMLYNFIFAVLSGSVRASGFDAIINAEGAARAVGTMVFSGASGTVGGVYNGVTLTAAHGASDTVDATAHAALINASVNALVANFVQASNTSCTLTLASVLAGTTIRLGQWDFTARATATLVQYFGEFDNSGNDTADAAALAAAINAHPLASKYYVATSAAAVVTLFQLSAPAGADGSTSTNISATASTVTISAQPAAGTTVVIASYRRDRLANCITIAASGTGVTASGARLTGGLGGNAIPLQEAV